MKYANLDGTLIPAITFRIKENLNTCPNNYPGYYKWWAPIEVVSYLLNSPYISHKYLDQLLPYLTSTEINNKTYYYLYVGVAIRESIRDRLNWHINQRHSQSSVESGFLSTLRQTLSSLGAGNQYNETKTNEIIDMLYVEYYPVTLPIKSERAKNKIEKIEKREMKRNLLPLNLKDNKNEIAKPFLDELKIARKQSKNKGVISCV